MGKTNIPSLTTLLPKGAKCSTEVTQEYIA